jgi:hypothetical protein
MENSIDENENDTDTQKISGFGIFCSSCLILAGVNFDFELKKPKADPYKNIQSAEISFFDSSSDLKSHMLAVTIADRKSLK